MKSAHEICGCLDGVRCQQATEIERLTFLHEQDHKLADHWRDQREPLIAQVDQLTQDRDRLMGLVNSAENRARLAEDRERVARTMTDRLKISLEVAAANCHLWLPDSRDHIGRSFRECHVSVCRGTAELLAALDAQEPRT